MRVNIYTCDCCGKRLAEDKFPATEGWYIIERQINRRTKQWHICNHVCMSSWVSGPGWPRDTVEDAESR